MPPDIAMKIATKLADTWAIGGFSRFCDEPPDFDYATEEDIAATIREVLGAECSEPRAESSIPCT